MTISILSALGAYFIGSIPFGYIAGLVYGVDIRTKSSGNIGATNVFRTLGKKPGIFVFVADAMKGVAAVRVVPQGVAYAFGETEPGIFIILACAVFVFLGHIFPAWLGFKGGKGVATGLGLAIGIAPLSAGIAFGVWLVVFIAGRYVSLASILAAVVLAAASWFLDNAAEPRNYAPAVMTALALFVIVKHRSNIKRLVAGTENRFSFSRKG
ncbi:MAG: glycerol-3-phosphate 1-O-acyltransferase PlsY [Kiritimatiellaeota bacterium]|nr:glycerol-3-phosphate 1-O-acyltransferase PlsY [Kiritimatiellota bacterium]